MKEEKWDAIKVAALGLALGFGVADLFTDYGLKKRIERLENRAATETEAFRELLYSVHGSNGIMALHLEYQHGIVRAKATNETSITISNASEKTITVTFPKPYEAKEAK